MTWLDQRLVPMLHDRQIAEHGGSSGLCDAGLLESALACPQQLHAYGDPAPDLAALAANLAHGIARNHAFVDGNKRSAYVCYRTFLELNQARLDTSPEEKYASILALADGRLSEAEFADWLRARLRLETPDNAIQEPPAVAYAGR